MATFLLFLAVCLLAYANGANDNFKGVATLLGSGTTSFRTALLWATATTFAGSVCSIYLAQSLLHAFSGKGLVPSELANTEAFVMAVAVGAGGTVLLATLTGFPISTTHSLVGAIAGSGFMAAGSQVNLSVLMAKFFLPLLVSPLAALVVGAALYYCFRLFRLRLGVTKEWCVCIGSQTELVPIPQPATALTVDASPLHPPTLVVDEQTSCALQYAGTFWGIPCQKLMDSAHFVSAGIVSFARGLNDTPKIAALLLVIHAFDIRWGLVAVATMIALGGLVSARRVAQTMSHRITDMNHGQGFSANLATGLLVIGASRLGMPVSTTHVSVGALLGIGLTTGQAHPRMIGGILLSWLVTLPCAATIAAGVTWWNLPS